MIKTFKHKGLRQFFETGNAKKLPVKQTARVAAILEALDAAKVPGDMNLPGWRFHPLGKMGPGRYACEASANYRVTFAFEGQDAVDVDIEDYH